VTDDAVTLHGRRLFGRSLVYVIVWALGPASVVLVTPILTRALGPEDFGRLTAALTVGQVLAAFAGLGLTASIIRLRVRSGDDLASRGLVFVAMAGAAVMSAALYVAGPVWARLLGFPSYSPVVQLVVIWCAPTAAVQAAMALLRAQDRLAGFSAVSVAQSVGTQVVAIAAVVLVAPTPTAYAAGLTVAQFVAAALAILLTRPRPAGLGDTEVVREAMRIGLPLVPQAIAVFTLNAGDRLVIQHLMGPAAVGRYQVSYGIGSVLLLVMAALNQSWESVVIGIHDPQMRITVLGRARRDLLRIVAPLAASIALAAPFVLRLFAPGSFAPHDLVIVTALVVASAVPYALYLSGVLALLSVGRTGLLAVGSAVCAAVNIALNFALIPSMGLAGAALATWICYALQAGFTNWAANARLRGSTISARDGVSCVAVVLVICATSLLPESSQWLPVRLLLAAGCSVAALGVLRRSAVPQRTSVAAPPVPIDGAKAA